jgi:hypothetical protein
VFHISKVKIFKGEPKKTRADELREGKSYKFEGEGGGYKYWPLDPDGHDRGKTSRICHALGSDLPLAFRIQ